MSRVWLSAVGLLALAAIGCGGALSGETDGGGSGGTGVMTGGAGTTGSGGAAGSPYEGGYTWGNTMVFVGASDTVPDTFSFTVQKDTALQTMVTLPAATDRPPTNGARLIAHYGCTNRPLYALDVYSCALAPDGTTPPGCLTFSLDDQGVMIGEYVDAAGARCIVHSGTANLLVPPPGFAQPAGTDSPRDAATGGYNFMCNSPEGPLWYVTGTFAIPVQSTSLLCAD